MTIGLVAEIRMAKDCAGMVNGPLYLRGFVGLTIIYIVFYGGLLYHAGGLPYVFDNNETFSSLWHARNLFNFGLGQSFGLADEAFSYSAAAHPYVHTHQGNFPRLFAFVIYLLGARTAESQIVITTFTVGLATLYFAYQYFFKTIGTLFAVIFCLILFSDYLLVAQWQVVTYRVWYGFFVFSSLLCVHACGENRRWWPYCTFVNFACLFYFELVFAAFVFLGAAFYALAAYWRSPRVVMRFFTAQAAGCVVGLSVLTLQLVLYMGWKNFLQDIYFTFVARNHYDGSAEALESMRAFFDSNNIVFWHNLVDGSQYRSILHFAGSLTYYEFQLHTPLFTTLCWIILLGLIGACWFHGSANSQVRPEPSWVMAATAGLTAVAVFALFSTVFERSSLWGIHDAASWRSLSDPGHALLYVLASGFALVVLYLYWARPGDASFFLAPEKSMSARRTAIFVLIATALVSESWIFYNENYASLGLEVSRTLVPKAAANLAVLLSVALGAALIRRPALLGETGLYKGLKQACIFFLSGMAAYAVVFLISPGYIFSGYRFRLAPFTIFYTQVLIAVVVYALVLLCVRQWKIRFHEPPPVLAVSGWSAYKNLLLPGSGLVLLGFLCFYWFGMQAVHIKLFPPDNYLFINKLSEPPYKGKTFIVNGYAAPIAEKSGNWAYLHASLTEDRLAVLGDLTRIPFDKSYLWFADKTHNPSYEKPDYFICIKHQSLSTANSRIEKESGIPRFQGDCSNHVLVRMARQIGVGQKIHPVPVLAEIDTEGMEKVGFTRWAIVKLDWKP